MRRPPHAYPIFVYYLPVHLIRHSTFFVAQAAVLVTFMLHFVEEHQSFEQQLRYHIHYPPFCSYMHYHHHHIGRFTRLCSTSTAAFLALG